MKRAKLPPSQMLTLPIAANFLGWDVDQLLAMESFGELQTVGVETEGRTIKLITLEEVARLQSATVKQPERYNPQERKSHLYLLGILAHIYEPNLKQHYKLREVIEADASAKGLAMLRSVEADAITLKEAWDLIGLRSEGDKEQLAA